MNIPVLTSSGHVIVRPDTSWEHNSDDWYPPEFVSRVSYAPVVFACITRPGKSIVAKFSRRYFGSIGFGVLLYPEDLIDGSEEGFACSCCLDHTSFLTIPKADCLHSGLLHLSANGRTICDTAPCGQDRIEAAIAEISKYCLLRTGDLAAIELMPRQVLCNRSDGPCSVQGSVCGDKVLDFRIIF